MEEFVVSDLMDSSYILSAAILDDQGFVITSKPNDSKTKEQLSKFAEILYSSEDFDQTSIITEERIIIIHKLVKDFTLVLGCDTKSNLGFLRNEISSAVSRLNTYFDSTSR